MSPISPNAASPSRTGDAARRRGDRERDPEVGAGLVDPDAAGDVDEDVGAAERQPGVPREHGDDHREPLRDRRRSPTRRGIARSVGATSDWISSRSGRVPSSAQSTAAPTSPGSLRPKSADGSGTPTSPVAGHLEHAELVRRAEAVLRRPQDAVGVVAVALELEHAVDEVLEHARAGDRAVLGHVADEERRDARPPSRRAGAARRPRAPARPSRAPSRARPSRASAPSRSRRRPGRSRSSVAQTASSSVSARISTASQPPSRAARSFTCAADSSPVTSSARRLARASRRAPIRSSVDLPTPGSPPTSTSEAGTSPPPSTRSSSATPVGMRSASSASTSTSRRSGRRRGSAARRATARPPRPASRTRRSRGSARASGRTSCRTRCRRDGGPLPSPCGEQVYVCRMTALVTSVTRPGR